MSFGFYDPWRDFARRRDWSPFLLCDDDSCDSNTSNPSSALTPKVNRAAGSIWRPVVDVRETDKDIIVHAELPGLKKDDININIEDNVLTLSGERSHTEKTENERYHRIERSYGKFQRSFALPENTDPSTIQANFENGVLELTVPKSAPKTPTKHRVAIGSAAGPQN